MSNESLDGTPATEPVSPGQIQGNSKSNDYANRLLLRVWEAAEVLGISRSKAYELIKEGTIPSVSVGSSLRIPVAALERWIQEQLDWPQG